MLAAVLALALAASPGFDVAPGFEPAVPLRREAGAGWNDLARLWTDATHAPPPPAPHLTLSRGLELRPGEDARNTPGRIALRQTRRGALTTSMIGALRRALARRLLDDACLAAHGDALFQEAFARAASGEPQVAALDVWPREHGLPRPVAEALERCTHRGPWQPLDPGARTVASTRVAINLHSGEVLELTGDARKPLAIDAIPEALRSRPALLHALGSPTPLAVAQALRALALQGIRSFDGPGLAASVEGDVVALGVGRDAPQTLGLLHARFRERAQRRVEVQVLGLVPAAEVRARCAGVVVVGGLPLPEPAPTRLDALTAQGEALCLGAPWRLTFPGGPPEGRAYAGSFRWDAPPPYASGADAPPTTERQRRAREGSAFIFATALGPYVAGVLRAEDATLVGEPRRALAQVVAHDAYAPRHGDRPVCDTTHCQAFLGTAPLQPGDVDALEEVVLAGRGWLTFSQGGEAPWSEVRPREQVGSVLGGDPASLELVDGKVRVRFAGRDDAPGLELPCERLRGPLQLPSCPEQASIAAREVRFRGHGRGHGEGLDVEAAKNGALDHRALLERAFGARP